MASCHLSFSECERLYSLVVSNQEFRAFTRLHDHAVPRLAASLERQRRFLCLADLDSLCEDAFTTTALRFQRIPTWGQAFSFGRIVSVSLARRAILNGDPAVTIEGLQIEPSDPRSAAFAESTDFADLLEALVRALDAAELTSLVHLVRSACLGRQPPEALAAELEVCLRTMRAHRKVLLRKLHILLAHFGLVTVLPDTRPTI